ncbi:MAG: hypothetical protein NDJ94_17265 [Vicinamibacteria bacterium]|jgi:hypothetical protein|nr:hypothetical protein [Vicinamibacteria bacterium]
MRSHIGVAALALVVSVLGGCGWGSGGDGPAPAPTPGPTRPPVNTTLPAGWDLAFPAGTVIEGVNWGEPDPARDRVQIRLPEGTDARQWFTRAFEARGLTVEARVTDGSWLFLEAEGGPGRESFGVELPASGVVLVTRDHPPR